jgi:purine-nucleoside phosphorylase
VDNIGDIRTSYAKVDKMTIVSEILNSNTICGTKSKVKIHRSVHRTVTSKTITIKDLLNVFAVREVITIKCGGDLNPKKKLRELNQTCGTTH